MKNIPTVVVVLYLLSGCGEIIPPPDSECNSNNFYVKITKVTGADCGISTGQIVAFADGGEGNIQYQLGDGPFQDSGLFNSVKPGVYVIHAKDENNCTASVPVTVESGISFQASIKPIIERSCAIPNCHDGSGAITYLVFENIKANPGDIKARTQAGNMPKDGPLPQDEIEKIACWVDDGALNN